MTFIDLFAGAGGLSEGFYQEGFTSLVHVDFDKPSCDTLSERMRTYNYTDSEIRNSVICGDMTSSLVHSQIEAAVNGNIVDVLVGGPPCQAFSSVGRAQDPNSMRNDPRNYLFRHYLEILERFRPRIFIFENVSGLLTAKPEGHLIFPEIIASMSVFYDVCDDKDTILLNSVHYGVPQIRKRIVLIGVRRDLPFSSKDVYSRIKKTHYSPTQEAEGETKLRKKYRTVQDAIGDLPSLLPGEGQEEILFNPAGLNEYVSLLRPVGFDKLYNHVARSHNQFDRERYRLLSRNNWQLRDLINVRPDLVHHNPVHFTNRYTVQSYNNPGCTVVSHLYKDGNLFIHPDYNQERTFTVREAARIQSFPDDFRFCGSRTDQYKQVGNAVPPLMARQLAKAINQFL